MSLTYPIYGHEIPDRASLTIIEKVSPKPSDSVKWLFSKIKTPLNRKWSSLLGTFRAPLPGLRHTVNRDGSHGLMLYSGSPDSVPLPCIRETQSHLRCQRCEAGRNEPGKEKRGSLRHLPELSRTKRKKNHYTMLFIYAEPGRERKWKEVPWAIADEQLWETQGTYIVMVVNVWYSVNLKIL